MDIHDLIAEAKLTAAAARTLRDRIITLQGHSHELLGSTAPNSSEWQHIEDNVRRAAEKLRVIKEKWEASLEETL